MSSLNMGTDVWCLLSTRAFRQITHIKHLSKMIVNEGSERANKISHNMVCEWGDGVAQSFCDYGVFMYGV